MKNIFFKQAMHQASRLAGKPGRILALLARLTVKLYETGFTLNPILEKAKTLGRMTSAYARGHYTNIPWKSFLKILAALLYFVNPFDLIPDVVPGVGLTDDFAVLAWVYGAVQMDINKFLTWEKRLETGTVLIG